LWLNAGVPAPEVAERAGHSVEVLLRVYARYLEQGEDLANTRIEAALRVCRLPRTWDQLIHVGPLLTADRGRLRVSVWAMSTADRSFPQPLLAAC